MPEVQAFRDLDCNESSSVDKETSKWSFILIFAGKKQVVRPGSHGPARQARSLQARSSTIGRGVPPPDIGFGMPTRDWPLERPSDLSSAGQAPVSSGSLGSRLLTDDILIVFGVSASATRRLLRLLRPIFLLHQHPTLPAVIGLREQPLHLEHRSADSFGALGQIWPSSRTRPSAGQREHGWQQSTRVSDRGW